LFEERQFPLADAIKLLNTVTPAISAATKTTRMQWMAPWRSSPLDSTMSVHLLQLFLDRSTPHFDWNSTSGNPIIYPAPPAAPANCCIIVDF